MDEHNLSEKKINVLTNILSEAGYIQGQNLSRSALEEIPEFIVLAKILSSPTGSLDSDSLQKGVEVPLAMVLSNLAADGIIVQSPSSYRWGLTPKIKEKIDMVQEEEEEVVPQVVDDSPVEPSVSLSEALLAEALHDTPYSTPRGIATDTPEGQIIHILYNHGPLTSEELEKKSTHPSTSLALSNLQADGIIVQNPDYSWGLSPKIMDTVNEIRRRRAEELEAKKEQEMLENKIQEGHLITYESEEYRDLLDALKDTSYLQQASMTQNLAEIPEIEILALLYKHESLTTQELEEKSQYAGPISLALSNLKADQLITDNMDRWRLHQLFLNKIRQRQTQKKLEHKSAEEEEREKVKLSRIEEKNRTLRHIVMALERRGIQYGERGLDPKFAASVPEIEILYLLSREGPLSTDELEKKAVNRNSISLALSNLQADRVIQQDSMYQWQVVQSLMNDIMRQEEEEIQVVEEVVEIAELHTTEALREKEILSEKLKLRKMFFDLGLIASPDVPISELMKRTDFELLSIILHNQPIETDEIDEKLNRPILLSMELSNLAADDLIYYSESESKWRISTRLQSMLRKIRLDESEIIDTLKAEAPTTVEESQSPMAAVERPKSAANPMDQKLARYLKEKGYEIDEELPYDEMKKIGEFEVLKLIAIHAPVTVGKLEELVSSHVSTTLALSNLKADGLVVEENYTYSLVPSMAEEIHFDEDEQVGAEVSDAEEPAPDNSPAEEQEPPRSVPPEVEAEIQKEEETRKKLLPFMRAVKSLGIIDEIDLPHHAFLSNPEYEILYLIHENEGRPVDTIKQQVTSTSPVLVSRSLKKFEADEIVHLDDNGNVFLTEKFKALEK